MATEFKKVPIPRRGVDYRGKIVLAPMVRSGELPSRLLALHYGADLVWGPETVDKAMIGTTRRVHEATNTVMWTRKPSQGVKDEFGNFKDSIIYQMHPEKEGRKLVFQMGTSNPDLAVEAARLVAADVAGIDVNAGCPKPFSVHCGMGAALLQTPDLLCSILEALVKNIATEHEIGISVKIRILDTPEKTEVLVRRLVATGITGLTVHCRTTPMRPRERAIRDQLSMVADICREAGVACLMNGDVEDREQALKLIEEYGVDGAMIATCAEKNSSCFRSQADGGSLPWKEVAEQYIRYAMEVENKFGNTKFLLSQIIPGKQPASRELPACKSYTVTCEALGFTSLLSRAQEVDETLGIDPQSVLKTTMIKQAEQSSSKKSKKNKQKKLKTPNETLLASCGQTAEIRSPAKKSLSERGVNVQTPAQIPEGLAIPF